MLNPDDQRNDWYGWTVNQAGHAAIVGVAMAGAFLWLPPQLCVLTVAALYFVIWEWAYQIVTLRSKLYRDAVADTINVAFGAALAVADGAQFWTVWGGWMVVLAIGAGYRR